MCRVHDIGMDLAGLGCEEVDYIHVAYDRVSSEQANEASCY
jgi:hypothetical protein